MADQFNNRTRRFSRFQLLALGILAVVLLIGVKMRRTDGNSLERYVCADGGYSILFPKQYVECSRLLPTAAGGLKFTLVQRQTRKLFFMAGYCDWPGEFVDSNGPTAVLDDAMGRIVEGFDGVPADQKDIRQDDTFQRTVKVTVPGQMIIHVRLILRGQRMYRLMVAAISEKGDDGQIAEVLDSFQMYP